MATGPDPSQPHSSHQHLDLIRRYARILRHEQAKHRGPHITDRARRFERQAEHAARHAMNAMRPSRD
jgi:hypothetical protein